MTGFKNVQAKQPQRIAWYKFNGELWMVESVPIGWDAEDYAKKMLQHNHYRIWANEYLILDSPQ